LLSSVVKIPWHYHHFPWLSRPGNGLSKFDDFPWPGGTLNTTIWTKVPWSNLSMSTQGCYRLKIID